MKKTFAILFSLLFCSYLFAEDYSYLNGKKGQDIRKALHEKIKNHTVLGYNSVWASATGVDDRKDGSNNIWDMYSNCIFSKYDKCGGGESEEDCECYNREHSLPKSWWGGSTTEPMYTDLHHIIPTDRLANTQRSAWPLGEVDNVEWTNGSSYLGGGTFGNSSSSKTFEPADEYKGDFARIYFYMATCYMDKDFTQGGKGFQVFKDDVSPVEFTTKALTLYLEWHRSDPVSKKEKDRNEGVAKKQGNRNPFVDDPDLVEYIWGKKKNVAFASDHGVENIHVATPVAQKVLMDGILYIVRDGKVYTIQGVQVR